jgi:hypothetical protein
MKAYFKYNLEVVVNSLPRDIEPAAADMDSCRQRFRWRIDSISLRDSNINRIQEHKGG